MRLVVLVCGRSGVSAGRVHKGNDGHGQVTVTTDDLRSLRMMRRPPDAVVDRPILRDEANAAIPRIELQLDFGGVQRAIAGLDDNLAFELTNDIARAGA